MIKKFLFFTFIILLIAIGTFIEYNPYYKGAAVGFNFILIFIILISLTRDSNDEVGMEITFFCFILWWVLYLFEILTGSALKYLIDFLYNIYQN